MKRVLSVDPGLRALGYAVTLNGELEVCGVVESGEPGRGARVWRSQVDTLHERLADHGLSCVKFHACYVEHMVHRKARNDVPLDDLFQLVAIAGGVVASVDANEVVSVEPHVWKGYQPKRIHQQRILKALTAHERVLVRSLFGSEDKLEKFTRALRDSKAKLTGVEHNAIDAIGIALYAADRLRP